MSHIRVAFRRASLVEAEDIGGGFYRVSHRVWEIARDADGELAVLRLVDDDLDSLRKSASLQATAQVDTVAPVGEQARALPGAGMQQADLPAQNTAVAPTARPQRAALPIQKIKLKNDINVGGSFGMLPAGTVVQVVGTQAGEDGLTYLIPRGRNARPNPTGRPWDQRNTFPVHQSHAIPLVGDKTFQDTLKFQQSQQYVKPTLKERLIGRPPRGAIDVSVAPRGEVFREQNTNISVPTPTGTGRRDVGAIPTQSQDPARAQRFRENMVQKFQQANTGFMPVFGAPGSTHQFATQEDARRFGKMYRDFQQHGILPSDQKDLQTLADALGRTVEDLQYISTPQGAGKAPTKKAPSVADQYKATTSQIESLLSGSGIPEAAQRWPLMKRAIEKGDTEGAEIARKHIEMALAADPDALRDFRRLMARAGALKAKLDKGPGMLGRAIGAVRGVRFRGKQRTQPAAAPAMEAPAEPALSAPAEPALSAPAENAPEAVPAPAPAAPKKNPAAPSATARDPERQYAEIKRWLGNAPHITQVTPSVIAKNARPSIRDMRVAEGIFNRLRDEGIITPDGRPVRDTGADVLPVSEGGVPYDVEEEPVPVHEFQVEDSDIIGEEPLVDDTGTTEAEPDAPPPEDLAEPEEPVVQWSEEPIGTPVDDTGTTEAEPDAPPPEDLAEPEEPVAQWSEEPIGTPVDAEPGVAVPEATDRVPAPPAPTTAPPAPTTAPPVAPPEVESAQWDEPMEDSGAPPAEEPIAEPAPSDTEYVPWDTEDYSGLGVDTAHQPAQGEPPPIPGMRWSAEPGRGASIGLYDDARAWLRGINSGDLTIDSVKHDPDLLDAFMELINRAPAMEEDAKASLARAGVPPEYVDAAYEHWLNTGEVPVPDVKVHGEPGSGRTIGTPSPLQVEEPAPPPVAGPVPPQDIDYSGAEPGDVVRDHNRDKRVFLSTSQRDEVPPGTWTMVIPGFEMKDSMHASNPGALPSQEARERAKEILLNARAGVAMPTHASRSTFNNVRRAFEEYARSIHLPSEYVADAFGYWLLTGRIPEPSERTAGMPPASSHRFRDAWTLSAKVRPELDGVRFVRPTDHARYSTAMAARPEYATMVEERLNARDTARRNALRWMLLDMAMDPRDRAIAKKNPTSKWARGAEVYGDLYHTFESVARHAGIPRGSSAMRDAFHHWLWSNEVPVPDGSMPVDEYGNVIPKPADNPQALITSIDRSVPKDLGQRIRRMKANPSSVPSAVGITKPVIIPHKLDEYQFENMYGTYKRVFDMIDQIYRHVLETRGEEAARAHAPGEDRLSDSERKRFGELWDRVIPIEEHDPNGGGGKRIIGMDSSRLTPHERAEFMKLLWRTMPFSRGGHARLETEPYEKPRQRRRAFSVRIGTRVARKART